MGNGFRTATSGGVAAPPYTNGPYRFSEVITFEDDVTVEGDLTVEGSIVFGDAATDTLTVTGLASFSNANVTENDKIIEVDSTITDATHGARQGGVYIGVVRTTEMTGSDGNPDCGLKLKVDNQTASEDYARLRGIDLSVETDASGDGSYFLEGGSFTVKDASGTTINAAGHMKAVIAQTDKNGTGDCDVIGFYMQDNSQSATGTHYGMKIYSANYDIAKDYGIHISAQNGSWAKGVYIGDNVTDGIEIGGDVTNGLVISGTQTSAVKITGAGTNLLEFDAVEGAVADAEGESMTVTEKIAVKIGENTRYIQVGTMA